MYEPPYQLQQDIQQLSDALDAHLKGIRNSLVGSSEHRAWWDEYHRLNRELRAANRALQRFELPEFDSPLVVA